MADQKSWADYSASELQTFRQGLDMEKLTPEQAAQIPALDALIVTKVAEEAVSKSDAQKAFVLMAKKLDAKAKAMYPELKDKESDLAKKTAEYMDQMGTASKDANALMTASMLAAEDLGVDPVQYRKDAPNPDKTGVAPDGKPVEKPEGEGAEFLGRTTKLATLLSNEGLLDLEKEGVKERLIENHAKALEDM